MALTLALYGYRSQRHDGDRDVRRRLEHGSSDRSGFGLWRHYLGARTKSPDPADPVALEFYRRFAEIAERMPIELRLASSGSTNWPDVQNPDRSQMLVSIMSYLNLSAEEFALHRKGRLSRDVWQVTSREIEANFATSLWGSIWKEVRSGYTSQPEYAALIDAIVARSDRPPSTLDQRWPS